MSDRWNTRLRIALFLIAALGGGNFIAFMIHDHVRGGQPGPIKNGRYYAADKGRYTEITKSQYVALQYHMWSVLAAYPLAAGAAILLIKLEKNLRKSIPTYKPPRFVRALLAASIASLAFMFAIAITFFLTVFLFGMESDAVYVFIVGASLAAAAVTAIYIYTDS